MEIAVIEQRQAHGGPDTPTERAVAATLVCIARWGLRKTTLDDVAREAGISRATLYRAFPGGKDALLEAVIQREFGRFFGDLAACLDAANDLEDLLVTGIHAASHFLADHAALGNLLRHEPELLLSRFAFHRLDPLLVDVRAFAVPHIRAHLPAGGGAVGRDDMADRLAELAARVVLSFALHPSPRLDLTDPGIVRRVVRTYLIPGLVPDTHQPLQHPKEPHG